MKPIKTPKTNGELTSRQADVDPLPYGAGSYADGVCFIESVWRVPLWEALRMLVRRRAYLQVLSPTHPPVHVSSYSDFGQ